MNEDLNNKLNLLFLQCTNELKSIGIDINQPDVGKISVQISKRNNKRYGCCKQEEPDAKYKVVQKIGRRRVTKYQRFNKHTIEVSKWVFDLNDETIKNTIMHEIIHCFPYCNDHGKQFKMYAKYINSKLGYNISRLGNKKQDYENSNVQFEEEKYKYQIKCTRCGKLFHRNRLTRNFFKKYRCLCGGKLELKK